MDIAIINKNKSVINFNITFTNIDDVKQSIYNDITNNILQNISLKTLPDNSQNTFCKALCEYIDSSQVISTYNVYYTDEYLYQLIYIEVDKQCCNDETLNYLGTQLTNGSYCIDNVIIIKNKILNDNSTELVSITKEDLLNLMCNTIIKKGVIVEPDNTIKEFEYINSPLEKYSYDLIKKMFRYLEIKLYNCILEVYYKIDDVSNKLNINGSYICNKKVNDTIALAISYCDNSNNCKYHISCDEKYFNKIINLLKLSNYEPLYDNYENTRFCNIYRCINFEYDKFKDNTSYKILDDLSDENIVNKII